MILLVAKSTFVDNLPAWFALLISAGAALTAYFRGRSEKDMTLLDQVQEERAELKKDRAELHVDIDKCKQDCEQIRSELETTKLALRAAQEQIALLKIENAALKNHIKILEGVA